MEGKNSLLGWEYIGEIPYTTAGEEEKKRG